MENFNFDKNFNDHLKPIPFYPKLDPEAIEVRNSDEELVNIGKFFDAHNVYNTYGYVPQREAIYLRKTVVNKLLEAERLLPEGFGFLIFDGHRTMDFQKQLLNHFLKLNPSLKEGFVSDPSNLKLVPPHTTGGAVDLTLTFKGVEVDMGTEYDSFEDAAYVDGLEKTNMANSLQSQARRVLYHALSSQGFAPYPLEWWHWSYGDQWWAAFYGKEKTLFNTLS